MNKMTPFINELKAKVAGGDGDKEAPHKCGRCLKPASMRCSNCKKVRYCGKECQEAAWKKHTSNLGAASPSSTPRGVSFLHNEGR